MPFFDGLALALRVALCTCIFLLSGFTANAQSPAKIARIGLLVSGSVASSQPYVDPLRNALTSAGLVEGRNILLDVRYADGDPERLDLLARELVAGKPDLLFAGGDQGASAVKRATSRIPIVVVACDALAAGLVSNLARPGGNVTGVTCINSELAAKRVELFRGVLPSTRRLGVMLNPADPRMAAELGETEKAARAASIAVQVLNVSRQSGIAPAFQNGRTVDLDGVVVVFDALTFAARSHLAEAAVHQAMPTMFNFRQYVDAGGLISYGPNLPDMYRQSVRHIVKVLNGEKPGDIPMEQPTKFELIVNLQTAKAIGLAIPPSILARADEVIE